MPSLPPPRVKCTTDADFVRNVGLSSEDVDSDQVYVETSIEDGGNRSEKEPECSTNDRSNVDDNKIKRGRKRRK